jgi:hypothetical protein
MTMLPMGGLDPDINANPLQSMFGPMLSPQMPQIQSRGMMGGMFGGGNLKNVIAGALSGYLASKGNATGAAGLQAMLHAKLLRQQRALDDQQYQHQRQDKFSDFKQEYDYKLHNPEAQQPTQTDRYIQEILDPNTPPERRALLQSVVVPPTLENVPGYGLVSIPRGVAPSAPPPAPVGKLTPLGAGGPSPQGSGGFPY